MIAVGANPKTVIDGNPTATSFILADGVHAWNNVLIPRPVTIAGNVDAAGKPKAVLAGGWDRTQNGGGIAYPVDSWGSADGGTLRNVEIRDYISASQQSALNGGLKNWTYDNLWVHHIRWGGIKLDSGAKLLRSLVDHCGQLNVKCEDAADGFLIEDTIIEYGNWLNWADWEWEGGGTKFPTRATNSTIRRVTARHNRGGGIWYDYAADGHLIEDCLAHDNQG
ncbi:MAG: right-handed parallel beta-helix repeat-containing protein, partial [Actinomycetota bacterium]|nr:right-handed parallel beta-helix repeat-containing protein [Actinomycetota bacterium]